ncbi:MAG: cytochrome c, partial [Saprospiraceae bacterium]
ASKESSSSGAPSVAEGEQVYKKYCILCHGADGKLGINGAKDLTVCKLTLDEREAQVKKGKNAMTPFEGILSETQIKSVASYTMTLK